MNKKFGAKLVTETKKTKSDKVENTLKNSIFNQIEFGFNAAKRTIYIEDPIDIFTGSFLEQRISAVFEMTGDEKSPIDVKISSYGGEVYGMFSAIDVIKDCKVKINTIGTGPVMSAAAFILAAGTGRRKVTKNTIVMIHMMSSWVRGTTADILTEAEHINDLQTKFYKLLEQHSKKDAKFWESKSKTNLYLPADKCIELGLVDEII